MRPLSCRWRRKASDVVTSKKLDDISKTLERALDELADSLDSGKSETLRTYLAAIGRFPQYSFGNALLIHQQRPDATHVAGFSRWKELGRSIRKGEKGIAIRAPLLYADKENPKQEKVVRGFKVAHVFDVSQTHGEPLPELDNVRGDPGRHLESLRAFAGNRGIELEYSIAISPAQGRSSGGKITLLPDLHRADEFSVLSHELAHELLHHRDGKRPLKTVRETEAEAVAFAVCSAVGLEARSACSDYIQLYQGDRGTLEQSLARIQGAASEILSAILPNALEPAREPLLETLRGEERNGVNVVLQRGEDGTLRLTAAFPQRDEGLEAAVSSVLEALVDDVCVNSRTPEPRLEL